MRRAPGFAAAAVMTLALGIGGNVAIFSLIDALLLKSLPVERPEELLVLRTGASYPAFQAFRQDNPAFVDLFATSGVTPVDTRVGGLPAERVNVSLVSGSYFSVLGVRAQRGRTFTVDEDSTPGAHAVAVASHGYWQRTLGGDPDVVGRVVEANAVPLAIVGVAPRGFFGEVVGASPDLWVPLSMWAQIVPGRNLLQSPRTAWLRVIGRIKPGVSVSAEEARLTTLYRQTQTDIFGPDAPEDIRRDISRVRVTLQPAAKGLSSLRTQFGQPLQVLMAMVALVLVLACANVANLVLARGAGRRREIGLRLALGISRGRLVGQLLTESFLLSAAGTAVGVVLAWWGETALLQLVSTSDAPVPLAVGLDARLLLFVITLSALTTLAFGLAPAWQCSRVDPLISIGREQSGSAGPGRWSLGSPMVVVQVAISVVLLTGAGLFLGTLASLRDVDLGFVPDRLLVADVDTPAAGYTAQAHTSLVNRVLADLAALPGVTSATVSLNGVLTGRDSSTNRMRPDGLPPGPDGFPPARWDAVGPGYLDAAGIPLVAGRGIEARDDTSAPSVVVINEEMGGVFFGTENPIGRRMRFGSGETERVLEIVGVARDVRLRGPREEIRLRFYLPYFQRSDVDLYSARFLVRTSADPEGLRDLVQQAIRSVDARLPTATIDAGPALMDRALVRERLVANLSAAFGLLAIGLACIGLYGLLAYRVARRTNEIGVRIALGAARPGVLWMILWQDLVLIAGGCAIGVPLAIFVSRAAQGLLFGVVPSDPATFASAVGVMVTVGVLAGLIPARRAARIDPMVALRCD